MLLVLSSPDIDESLAIDTALHLWYSAFLKDEHMKVIKALPQIVSQRETTEEYSTFRSNKLDITLNQIVWAAMLSYCNERQDFDRNEAQRTRRLELMAAFDLALQRDEYELRLLKHCPGHRVPIERFYDDRILLPFSQSRDLYTVPNPVLFFGRGWHLKRLETPLDGWYLNEIATFETSLASNDIYGKLYCHVKTLLKNLRARLVDKDSKCHLTLLNMDVYLLKKRVRTRFDRIEVSSRPIWRSRYSSANLLQVLEHIRRSVSWSPADYNSPCTNVEVSRGEQSRLADNALHGQCSQLP